jgi:hypothetical protein
MATTSNPKRRRYPTSFNGGESQDPDDVRVGETHHLSPDAAAQPGADTAADDAGASAAGAEDDDAGVLDDADEGRVGSAAPVSSSPSGVRRDRPRRGGDAADTRDPEDTRDTRERPR